MINDKEVDDNSGAPEAGDINEIHEEQVLL
jgi:hypothetical protein